MIDKDEMMEKVKINDTEYQVVKNNGDCLKIEEIESLLTDYFEKFDYVCGDYSYDKLRLKGFYEKNHKNVRKINDITMFDTYIRDYCAYGAKYFLLKKSNKVL